MIWPVVLLFLFLIVFCALVLIGAGILGGPPTELDDEEQIEAITKNGDLT